MEMTNISSVDHVHRKPAGFSTSNCKKEPNVPYKSIHQHRWGRGLILATHIFPASAVRRISKGTTGSSDSNRWSWTEAHWLRSCERCSRHVGLYHSVPWVPVNSLVNHSLIPIIFFGLLRYAPFSDTPMWNCFRLPQDVSHGKG